MKNYNEIAKSVFERKEQYETERKQRRKILTRTVTPICCVCFMALSGFVAWQGGMFSKAPIQNVGDAIIPGTKDWYGTGESEPQSNNSSQFDSAVKDAKTKNEDSVNTQNNTPSQLQKDTDELGYVVYNNKTYIQTGNIEYKEDMLDKKVGNGEDFEGFYKDVEGTEIYTVKDRPDLLVAKLVNGANIVLIISPPLSVK